MHVISWKGWRECSGIIGGEGVCSNDVGGGDFGEELINNVGGVIVWKRNVGSVKFGEGNRGEVK